MILNKKNATFFIPDQTNLCEALKRTTHMSIVAHQDDIEIMAYDGIIKCFGKKEQWFLGTVVTNGANSARHGIYKDYTDAQMIERRRMEQKKAAYIGEYGALALLNYESSEIKNPKNNEVVLELANLIDKARPQVIYTHNLADKHDTHIAVTIRVIKAIRRLEKSKRPKTLYGCEVWRNLDWMSDSKKVLFDASSHPNIANALVEVFDSQIIGGKRYDLATSGRRLSNATYTNPNKIDSSNSVILAMDLTALINDDNLDVEKYIVSFIEQFKEDVSNKIKKMIG